MSIMDQASTVPQPESKSVQGTDTEIDPAPEAKEGRASRFTLSPAELRRLDCERGVPLEPPTREEALTVIPAPSKQGSKAFNTAHDVAVSIGRRRVDSSTDPHRRLMAAVFQTAVDDIRRLSGRGKVSRSDHRVALAWVGSADRHWPFSFANLCEALGFDDKQTRSALTAEPLDVTTGASDDREENGEEN